MEQDDLTDSTYSWQRLTVSLIIAIVGNAGMWAVILVLPAVQKEFGVGRADATLPYILTMVGFALGNLVIGRAVDRFGVHMAISMAAIASAVGYGLSAITPTIFILSLLHFIIGFGTAACFGPLIADISHWFMKRRGLAVAIAASGNYLSGVVWPFFLTPVMAVYGWRGAYWVLAISTVVIMLPMALMLRKRVTKIMADRADAISQSAVRSTGFSPNTMQILLAVAGVACCVAMAMPQVHIVALCIDLGFGAVAGSQMLSLMLFGGVVSRLISGVLADKLGGLVTLLIGSTAQCIGLFLYLPFDGLVSLYIVSLVFGLSQGGIVPSYAIIVRETMPAKEAGARVGFVIMATIFGMAFGGWMSGWIYDVTGSYDMAFYNGIAWNFLNMAIAAFLLMRLRSNSRAVAA